MSEKHYPCAGGEFDRIVFDGDGSVWTRERTCKDANGGGYTFLCSECTYELHIPFGWNFHYCPNCGAKVVE